MDVIFQNEMDSISASSFPGKHFIQTEKHNPSFLKCFLVDIANEEVIVQPSFTAVGRWSSRESWADVRPMIGSLFPSRTATTTKT